MTQIGSMEYQFRQTGAESVKSALREITKEARQAAQETLRINKQNSMLQKQSERDEAAALRSQQQAMKSFASVQKQKYQEMQKYSLGEQYKQFSQRLNDFQRGAVAVGAAAYGVIRTGKAIYDFGKQGAQLTYTTQKFDRLSQSVGVTSNVFLRDLQNATKGTMSKMQLMDQAGQLLQLGLASNSQEAVILSRNMTALGQDMGEVTLAIANQSKRRLDQLGLSLVRFNEIEAELAAKNPMMDKQELFKQAFIQTSNETIAITGNMADSIMGKYQQMDAALADLKMNAQLTTASMLLPTVSGVSQFFQGVNALTSGDTALTFGAGGKFSDQSWVRNVMLGSQEKELQGVYGAPERTTRAKRQTDAERLKRSQIKGGLATAFYSAQSMAGGVTAPSAAAPTINYEQILPGALAMSAAQMQITDATAQLNAELNRQQAALDDLNSRGYSQTNEKVQTVKANIIDLNTQMQNAAQSQVDMTNQIMMSNIANAASEEEKAQKQLEYARATGQITDQAYQQQTALMAVSQAFADGKLNAEQAAQMAELVMQKLSALDGMSVDAFINLVIEGKGGAALGFGSGVGGQTIVNNKPGGGPSITMQAGGGSLRSPGWKVVGEHGYELVSPTGYVYPHGASRQMVGKGIIPGAAYEAGGNILLDGLMNITPTNAINYGATSTYNTPSKKSTSVSPADVFSAVAAPVVEAITEPIVMGVGQQVTQQSVQLQIAVAKQAQEVTKTNTLLAAILAKVASDNGIASAFVTAQGKYS